MGVELKLIFRYIRNLGFLEGLTLFFKVELFRNSKFRMAGYPAMVYLRPGTSDIKVFREIFLFGAYSFEVKPPPRTIVDAGANVGLSSIYFARKFPAAIIYAIEPEHSNFEALRRNVEVYSNIRPLQTALWSRDCTLRITDAKENHWAFTVEECHDNTPDSFRAISIATLMQQQGIEGIDILKMDIEGAERELFSEHYDYWLSRTRLLGIELHDWLKPGCSAVFFKTISRYNIRTTLHQGMLVIEFNA